MRFAFAIWLAIVAVQADGSAVIDDGWPTQLSELETQDDGELVPLNGDEELIDITPNQPGEGEAAVTLFPDVSNIPARKHDARHGSSEVRLAEAAAMDAGETTLSRSENKQYSEGVRLAEGNTLAESNQAMATRTETSAERHALDIKTDATVEQNAQLQEMKLHDSAMEQNEEKRLRSEEQNLIAGSKELQDQEDKAASDVMKQVENLKQETESVVDGTQGNVLGEQAEHAGLRGLSGLDPMEQVRQAALEAKVSKVAENALPTTLDPSMQSEIEDQEQALRNQNLRLGRQQAEVLKQIEGNVDGALAGSATSFGGNATSEGNLTLTAVLDANARKHSQVLQAMQDKVSEMEDKIQELRDETKTKVQKHHESPATKKVLQLEAEPVASALAIERAKLADVKADQSRPPPATKQLTPREKALLEKVDGLEAQMDNMHRSETKAITENESPQERALEAQADMLESRLSRLAEHRYEAAQSPEAANDVELSALHKTLQKDVAKVYASNPQPFDLPSHLHELAVSTKKKHLLKIKRALEAQLAALQAQASIRNLKVNAIRDEVSHQSLLKLERQIGQLNSDYEDGKVALEQKATEQQEKMRSSLAQVKRSAARQQASLQSQLLGETLEIEKLSATQAAAKKIASQSNKLLEDAEKHARQEMQANEQQHRVTSAESAQLSVALNQTAKTKLEAKATETKALSTRAESSDALRTAQKTLQGTEHELALAEQQENDLKTREESTAARLKQEKTQLQEANKTVQEKEKTLQKSKKIEAELSQADRKLQKEYTEMVAVKEQQVAAQISFDQKVQAAQDAKRGITKQQNLARQQAGDEVRDLTIKEQAAVKKAKSDAKAAAKALQNKLAKEVTKNSKEKETMQHKLELAKAATAEKVAAGRKALLKEKKKVRIAEEKAVQSAQQKALEHQEIENKRASEEVRQASQLRIAARQILIDAAHKANIRIAVAEGNATVLQADAYRGCLAKQHKAQTFWNGKVAEAKQQQLKSAERLAAAKVKAITKEKQAVQRIELTASSKIADMTAYWAENETAAIAAAADDPKSSLGKAIKNEDKAEQKFEDVSGAVSEVGHEMQLAQAKAAHELQDLKSKDATAQDELSEDSILEAKLHNKVVQVQRKIEEGKSLLKTMQEKEAFERLSLANGTAEFKREQERHKTIKKVYNEAYKNHTFVADQLHALQKNNTALNYQILTLKSSLIAADQAKASLINAENKARSDKIEEQVSIRKTGLSLMAAKKKYAELKREFLVAEAQQLAMQSKVATVKAKLQILNPQGNTYGLLAH